MNTVVFTTLNTDRLALRQLSIDDKQEVWAMRSDPEINKYIDRQPCKTLEDAINFIEIVNKNIEKKIALYWAITFKAETTFAGTICLFNFSKENNSCEIGYELMTKFQGKKIMKEAAQAVIDYAFLTLNLKKIIAITHFENQASINLLQQLGFDKSIENSKDNPYLNTFTVTRENDNSSYIKLTE